jgi:excisionase family DNA binding protein
VSALAEPLLTVDEAAAALNVSAQKVRRMIRSGELPVLRIGCSPKAPIRIDPEMLGQVIARSSAR